MNLHLNSRFTYFFLHTFELSQWPFLRRPVLIVLAHNQFQACAIEKRTLSPDSHYQLHQVMFEFVVFWIQNVWKKFQRNALFKTKYQKHIPTKKTCSELIHKVNSVVTLPVNEVHGWRHETTISILTNQKRGIFQVWSWFFGEEWNELHVCVATAA